MTRPLPTPAPEMRTGVVGDVVDTFGPHVETAWPAIAAQFVIGFGNAVGRGPHLRVGETEHHMNEYLLVVGATATGRKGDSKNAALRTLMLADANWGAQITSGLSSGEGLIHAVRDPVERVNRKGELELVDEGVSDKRLQVVQTEFSQPLKMFRREGNVLSDTLRPTWDGDRVIRTLTKNSPTRATEPHISIIGHTTPEDLRAYMADLEIANGLGNRFLYVLAGRARMLANPGRALESHVTTLVRKVSAVVERARQRGELCRTPAAARLWEGIYEALVKDIEARPGLLGQLLARGPAHVARLSALYALLDEAQDIDVEHVTAALAFWDYCVASTEIVFAGRTGSRVADRIVTEMLPGQELTVTEIREQLFAKHIGGGELTDGLDLLRRRGEVRIEQRETGGRPATVVIRIGPEMNHARGNDKAGVGSAESVQSPPYDASDALDAGGVA